MSKIITKEKHLSNLHCYISKDPLKTIVKSKYDSVLKLKCGHCFSYTAFVKTYIINGIPLNNSNSCPYCGSNIKTIPIIINKYLKKSNK